MELIYQVKDRPPFFRNLLLGLQQVLAIIAGTITLPLIVGNGMSQSAALLGAAIGSIIYLLFTKFKSPVLLGSSFSFIGPMSYAFAGAATVMMGYSGLLIGAILIGIVYIGLAIAVKFAGTDWLNKVMPPVIIGPTVAIIGLSLAPQAIQNLSKGSVLDAASNPVAHPLLCIFIGLIVLFTVAIISIYGKKMLRMVPFIIGILVGYIVGTIFTEIGLATGNEQLQIIDFSLYENIQWLPELSCIKGIKGFSDFADANEFFKYFGIVALSYIPVSFVSFAEHIADHKNLSFIIGSDLLKDPGLTRSLLGDGIGSIVGATIGGCPNTTYGESISCVAFSKNASTFTLLTASIISIGIAFIGPLMTFFATIPTCVVGGISICLYGFIATSGFRMFKDLDFNKPKNIIIVSTILVAGVGGLVINIDKFVVSPVAVSLILGILMNLVLNIKTKKKETDSPQINKDEETK